MRRICLNPFAWPLAVVVLLNVWGAWFEADAATDSEYTATLPTCQAAALGLAESNGTFTADIGRAEAQLLEARSRMWPHLNVTPGARFNFETHEVEGEFRADLGRHFLEIPQNILIRKMALREIDRAELLTARLVLLHHFTVVRLYANCLEQDANVAWTEQRAEAARGAAAAWAAIAVGDDPELRQKRRRSADAAESAGLQLQQTRAIRKMAYEELARFSGVEVSSLERLKPLADYRPVEVSLADCLHWAATHRRDLQSLEMSASVAEQAAKLARFDRLPRPALSFGYDDEDETQIGEDRERGAFATVSLEIPIWDAGATRARAAAREAEAQELRNRYVVMQSKLSEEVARAHGEWQRARREFEVARRDPSADQAARRADIAVESGRLSRLEYGKARLAYREHQLRLVQLNLDCYRREVELLEAIEATTEQWRAGLKMNPPGTQEP